MSSEITALLQKEELSREDVIKLLRCDDDEARHLYRKATATREKHLGNTVFLKGLIEYSNICSRNCLFCGVRKDSDKIERFMLSHDEVIEASLAAMDLGLGYIAIQGGEVEGEDHAWKIESLIKKIRELSHNEIGITLSLGEQSPDTYRKWFEAGAHRYLLRIEASGIDLYKKVHPGNNHEDYYRRIECLKSIRDTGYQTGTGLMVGLPKQTLLNLADDIFFMRDFDIDMCGLGPFIEHTGSTPGKNGTGNYFLKERFEITLRMIAIMRIMMKDINIVASTAMQVIDPSGREKAILAGANVIMPNLTPPKYRRHQGHIMEAEETDDANVSGLRLDMIPGIGIGLGKWGDTDHYRRRISKTK